MALHCGTDILQFNYLTRKIVPITGRASLFLVFLDFQKQNREERLGGGGGGGGRGITKTTDLSIQGYIILHRLQVHLSHYE